MIVIVGIKIPGIHSRIELNILQGEREMNNEIESNKALNENQTMNQIIIK
jgi:hypothetical protein